MSSDPATLLDALWETCVERSRLDGELKRWAAAVTTNSFAGNWRLRAESQLQIGREHIESTIHRTFREFEQRAHPDTATREFVDGAARKLIAEKVRRDMPWAAPPRGHERNLRVCETLSAARDHHIVYLDHVADAELRVLAQRYATPPSDVPHHVVTIDHAGIRPMTREQLEKRDGLRLTLLHRLFHATNGGAAGHAVDLTSGSRDRPHVQ